MAWVHLQGDDVCPRPGTAKIQSPNQNISAPSLRLSAEELGELESIAKEENVKVDRHDDGLATCKNSETPVPQKD